MAPLGLHSRLAAGRFERRLESARRSRYVHAGMPTVIPLAEIAELGSRTVAGSDAVIRRVVALVQLLMGVDLTVLSEIERGEYRFRWLETTIDELALSPGDSIPYELCLCSRVHAGEAPAMTPEMRDEPALWGAWSAIKPGLGVAWDLRAFGTSEVHLPDGSLYGTLCVHNRDPREFSADEQALLSLLARLVGDEIGRERASEALAVAVAGRERAEEERAQLIDELAHELLAPLAVVDGYAEAMLDGIAERDDEHLRLVRHEAARCARLVDDLAYLSRIEHGQRPEAVEVVDLARLLEATGERFLPLADAAGIRLEIDAGPCWALASPDRLEQVFGNLVRNALRAARGQVSLQAHAVAGAVVASVGDDGAGLRERERERVFDRFYRGPDARASSRGSGLGLTIARRLVEQAGGSLTAEARAPTGTRFVVQLPSAQPATAIGASSEDAPRIA